MTLPFTLHDPNGDHTNVTFKLPPDIEAEVHENPRRLLLHAGYVAAGTSNLTLHLADGRGGATEVVVALDVKPLRWFERKTWKADGPAPREHPAVWADAAGKSGRILLFGGSGYSPYLKGLSDAWAFDAASQAWTSLQTAGDVPAPGGSRRVAVIPGERVVYLHGGYGDGGSPNSSDLYRVTWTEGADTLTFKKLAQLPAKTSDRPAARALHAFLWDPVKARFVLFGGAGQKPFGDTWTATLDGDTVTWSLVATSEGPSPRYGFFSGFDAESGRLLLFSGAQGFSPLDPARDTWQLDVRSEPPSWTLPLEGKDDGVPPGRRNGCAVFDPTGPRLFVFGGTGDGKTTEPGLHVLDARPGKWAWTLLKLADEPPLRSSGMGVFEPMSGQAWLGFGNSATATFPDLIALGE